MNYIKDLKIRQIIKRALSEDIGKGDITNKLLFPKGKKIQAVILAGSRGIVCGLGITRLVFYLKDKDIKFTTKVKDGARVNRGQVLARVGGETSSILSAERVALNFLGLLSGVATRTAEFVNKINNRKVKIMDTRKTIPGLRELQKYAVRIGGGYNHRFRLDEMVLIKDNHLRVSAGSGSIEGLISKIKKRAPEGIKSEIEVDNLKEFKLALKANPDIIMLDNMKVVDVRKAVVIRRKAQGAKCKTLLEASGNIQLKNIRAYAQTGVDSISLGTLTRDIHSLDLSMEVK